MSFQDVSSYAGDVSPEAAFERRANEPSATLVDVRTLPEWQYVGAPDLSSLGKTVVFRAWQNYPDMTVAEDFVARLVDELAKRGVGPDAPVLFLCRSGVRSRSAAIAMTRAGWTACYNVSDGFEGPLDDKRRRGFKGGWQARGLPWIQS